VKEESNGNGGYFFPDHAGQQQQLVILYPDPVSRIEVWNYVIGINAVYLQVGFPEVLPVNGILGKIMEQRPDGPVAEPVKKAFMVFFAEKNGITVFLYVRLCKPVPFRRSQISPVKTRPSEPKGFLCPVEFLQSACPRMGFGRGKDGMIAGVFQDQGQFIRYDDQFAHPCPAEDNFLFLGYRQDKPFHPIIKIKYGYGHSCILCCNI
jgi:hypothetical protein